MCCGGGPGKGMLWRVSTHVQGPAGCKEPSILKKQGWHGQSSFSGTALVRCSVGKTTWARETAQGPGEAERRAGYFPDSLQWERQQDQIHVSKRSLCHLVWGTRGKRQEVPGQRAAASGRMGPAPGLPSLPLGPRIMPCRGDTQKIAHSRMGSFTGWGRITEKSCGKDGAGVARGPKSPSGGQWQK